MSNGKNLSSKMRHVWYKAGATFTLVAGAAFVAPSKAHAASGIDPAAMTFIQEGMDKLALVCGFIGGGLIGWGILRIASTMGDGQGAQASAGMTQIGGGVLAFVVTGLFKSLPTLLQ